MNLRRLEVHVPVPVLSRNRAQHWTERSQTRRVRRQSSQLAARGVLLALGGFHLDPRAPKRISFRLYMDRHMDADNPDLKPYIDGLRDAQIIHDDSRQSGHVIDLNAEQILAPGRRSLVIAVEFLEIAPQESGHA